MGAARRWRDRRWSAPACGSQSLSANRRNAFCRFAYVGEWVEQPLLYYQNNVGGSVALFRAIIETRTIPVVFSSTCAIYGIPKEIPIPEEHPQRPINPYGFSKLVVERILADLGHAHGLRSIALRYFNAAGADPEGDIGEAHDPEPHLIPRVLAAARDGAAVTVYGDDYETADGTCIRDYIHVVDIADAHIRALDYLLSGGSSCALNLANAQGYSVMDVIQVAQRVSGKTIRVETAPRRPGDPPVLVGSADRAKARLDRMGAKMLCVRSADCRCVELDAERAGALEILMVQTDFDKYGGLFRQVARRAGYWKGTDYKVKDITSDRESKQLSRRPMLNTFCCHAYSKLAQCQVALASRYISCLIIGGCRKGSI